MLLVATLSKKEKIEFLGFEKNKERTLSYEDLCKISLLIIPYKALPDNKREISDPKDWIVPTTTNCTTVCTNLNNEKITDNMKEIDYYFLAKKYCNFTQNNNVTIMLLDFKVNRFFPNEIIDFKQILPEIVDLSKQSNDSINQKESPQK